MMETKITKGTKPVDYLEMSFKPNFDVTITIRRYQYRTFVAHLVDTGYYGTQLTIFLRVPHNEFDFFQAVFDCVKASGAMMSPDAIAELKPVWENAVMMHTFGQI